MTLAQVAKWIVQVSLSVLAVQVYTILKSEFSSATFLQPGAAPETSASNLEPKKLAIAAAGEAIPSTSLIIWATAILPVNVAAYYLTEFVWLSTRDSELSVWPTIPRALFPLFPVLASARTRRFSESIARAHDAQLVVFLYAFVFPPPQTHMRRRRPVSVAMLDGVLLALAAAVYAAYIYPERMICQSTALAAAAAFASQSFVWAFFFHASQLGTARVIIGGSSRSAY